MKKNRKSEYIINQCFPGLEDGLYLRKNRPIAVGTGLIALDVVVTDREEESPRYWAGGTCGNVLTILAYLGWNTYPAATLGDDAAAQHILEEFRRFSVRTRFVQNSTTRHTPIIVEKISTRGSGTPRHRFVWTCPKCGSWFPGYQALPASEARKIVKNIPNASVFFFDRASRGALELAYASAERGALIIFEPTGVRDERLFREAIALSHIVKYSHERLGHLKEALEYPSPFLEIETLGGEGLRYRIREGQKVSSRWREMSAYFVNGLRDTAGAGDWCTAGLLHALGKRGALGLKEATIEDIEGALRLGQALAAVKCRYEGARGTMYVLRKKQLETIVKGILNDNDSGCIVNETDDGKLRNILETICPSCDRRNGEQFQKPTAMLCKS